MRVFLAIALLLCSANLFAGPLDKAHALYKQAVDIMKKDHRANAGQTLALLRQSQQQFLAAGELSPEDEAVLMKLNSHIYWQTKFSNSKQLNTAKALEKTEITTEPDEKEDTQSLSDKQKALEAEKNAKRDLFNKDLQQAKAYEDKHKNDPMSNMLNYLDLQTKVVDVEKALDLLAKTEHYNAELVKEKNETIGKYLGKMRNYESLLSNKSYDKLFENLANIVRYSKASPKEKSILKSYALEMMAMAKIKKQLLSLRNSRTLPLPRQSSSLTGVVVNIDEKGLGIITEDRQPGFISWNVVSEQTVLSLALNIIDAKDPNNLYLLALAHLRLENFEEAYAHFNELIRINPKNYLKYRDYLSICETGYRLKFGPKFEKTFEKVNKLKDSGLKHQAIDILVQFKDDYLNSELGQSYIERFSLIYKDLIRS